MKSSSIVTFTIVFTGTLRNLACIPTNVQMQNTMQPLKISYFFQFFVHQETKFHALKFQSLNSLFNEANNFWSW